MRTKEEINYRAVPFKSLLEAKRRLKNYVAI